MNITMHDPRPDDPAELARMVAKEPRKRGNFAREYRSVVEVACFVGAEGKTDTAYPGYHSYSVHFADFDNLGPIAIADEIQAHEARRAQEWAGDVENTPADG
jgi:hypothetical protein